VPAGSFQSEVITATPASEIVGVVICGRNEITVEIPPSQSIGLELAKLMLEQQEDG
jgi:hypothetical protein